MNYFGFVVVKNVCREISIYSVVSG